MKLIFAGTPEFAARALDALLESRHEVALVLSRTDKPAGRGQQLMPSPVKQRALAAGIPVLQPKTLKPGVRDEEHLQVLRDVRADLMIVAAYGLILPPDVLTIPGLGCLNIHASLLPRWRGAAPIQRAIESGDHSTGITIMQMDEGLDTGAMRLIKPLAIADTDTAATLHDRLAVLGATSIVEALELLEKGLLPSQPQPAEGACFAAKIDKAESVLDWTMSASALSRKLRALDPFPGCVTKWKDVGLKVWSARVFDGSGAGSIENGASDPHLSDVSPGTVLGLHKEGVLVQTGDGVLLLTELQKPGGKRLDARVFLAGTPLRPGDRFV